MWFLFGLLALNSSKDDEDSSGLSIPCYLLLYLYYTITTVEACSNLWTKFFLDAARFSIHLCSKGFQLNYYNIISIWCRIAGGKNIGAERSRRSNLSFPRRSGLEMQVGRWYSSRFDILCGTRFRSGKRAYPDAESCNSYKVPIRALARTHS